MRNRTIYRSVIATLLRSGRRDLAKSVAKEVVVAWGDIIGKTVFGKPSGELLKQQRDEKVVVKRGWPKPQQKLAASTFEDDMDELLRQQGKQRRKKIGIDGDPRVTDQIYVRQTMPGKVWDFVFTSTGMEIVRVNGIKRARAVRDLLQKSKLRDYQKLRELAFEWRKANPR